MRTRAGELGDGVVVLAVEDVERTLVDLAVLAGNLGEPLGGFVELAVTHGENAHHVVVAVAFLFLHLVEGVLCSLVVTLVEVSHTEVVLGLVGAVLLDSLLVDGDLAVDVLGVGGGSQESGLVEHVDVVVHEVGQFFSGVVGVLHVGDEAGAAQLREDIGLQGRIDSGHVLDLTLADVRVAVHRQDAEDQLLVFDVGVVHQFLEAFPVLTDRTGGHVAGVEFLGDGVEGLVGALLTVGGELVVEGFGAIRGSVGHDLGALDFTALVGGEGLEGFLEVFHVVAAELGIADVGAVDQIHDLGFGGLGDHFLIAVGHVVVATLGVGQHIGGVGTVGDLDVGGIHEFRTFIIDLRAAYQFGFLHTRDIVEMDFLGDGGTGLGDGLEVVGDFLALIYERLADGFTADIEEHGGHLERGLREEVLRREGHGYGCVDVAGDDLKHFRIALDVDLVGSINHFLGVGAGCEPE